MVLHEQGRDTVGEGLPDLFQGQGDQATGSRLAADSGTPAAVLPHPCGYRGTAPGLQRRVPLPVHHHRQVQQGARHTTGHIKECQVANLACGIT